MPSSLRPDPTRPLGLVLSGGGARGAFQVGVWKVLREDPRGLGAPPDVVSGTSAGALNGALIAAGLGPDEILEFWLDIARRPPVRANREFFASAERALASLALREPGRRLGLRARELRIFGALLGKHRWYRYSGLLAAGLEFLLTARFDSLSALLSGIRAPYLFDTSPLAARLARAIGGDVVAPNRIRLAINTVDIHTGRVVRIVSHPPLKHPRASARHYRVVPRITLDMIIASAAIPLLFKPMQIGDSLLWDGGLLVNTPMAPAVALGATRIVPVLVTPQPNGARAELTTFGRAIERLADAFLENAYNVDRKLLLARNALAERDGDPDLRVVELYRAIRPPSSELFGAGSYLYFEPSALLEMYAAGQEAARAWLARGPAIDARELDEVDSGDAGLTRVAWSR